MNFKLLDDCFRTKEKQETFLLEKNKYYALRVDGKGFSKLTKKYFTKPFDINFKEMFVRVINKVLSSYSFKIILAYSQSDEISFLLSRSAYGLKERKMLSLIPSAISAEMSIDFGCPVVFDCRLIPLDNEDDVVRYFVWRFLDSRRNSLNNYVYWTAINNGSNTHKAAKLLENCDYDDKISYLSTKNVNFHEVPLWTTNGFVVTSETYLKDGYNPLTDETVSVQRRRLKTSDVIDEADLIKTVLDVLDEDKARL